jgi:hypothetical protein
MRQGRCHETELPNYRVNLSAGGTNAATVTRVFARRRLRVRYAGEIIVRWVGAK